jgi:hexosaminidase
MKSKSLISGLVFILFLLYSNCSIGKNHAAVGISREEIGCLIPIPLSLQTDTGIYTLSQATQIYVMPDTKEANDLGAYLSDRISPATGFKLKVAGMPTQPEANRIVLTTVDADTSLGEEGYTLSVRTNVITITALNQTGLFHGIQTLRQLFPAAIESQTRQNRQWIIPDLTIRDKPRFAWRGVMLDVARHFFGVSDVKRLIDEMAYYKFNHLHLHLTDDQGWRIAISSWPALTSIGGNTQSGGGPGGFYTQEQYADIVAYAQSCKITIVPEIDMPGHCNAALASYAFLSDDAKTRAPYTGSDVGFSSFAIYKESTYSFIDDVVREIAALTPGPYIHLGGDEARTLPDSDYVQFIMRIQTIVRHHDKQLIGWEEISKAVLSPSTIVQLWTSENAVSAVKQGAKVIMSPSSKAYMDMKYNVSTPLGQDWAGMIEVKDGYDWDPATLVSGIRETNILGIEAPLWTETISTFDDAEFMIFPRLPGYAEIGWSPQAGRSWGDYSIRLAEHGTRLTKMGIRFYRSTQIKWQ